MTVTSWELFAAAAIAAGYAWPDDEVAQRCANIADAMEREYLKRHAQAAMDVAQDEATEKQMREAWDERIRHAERERMKNVLESMLEPMGETLDTRRLHRNGVLAQLIIMLHEGRL